MRYRRGFWGATLLGALVLAALPGAAVAAHDACGGAVARPWCSTLLTPDQRAGLLLSALTESEKLTLLAGASSTHTGETASIPRVGLRPVYVTDDGVSVKQGTSTAMPIPIAVAATFDPRMATLDGSVIGNEAKHKGNDVILGPTVNIMRTPIGGRTFESYGEDPFLTASTAVSWIDGAQSQGVIATVKHLCCNNQEGEATIIGEKNYSSSDLNERTLREIYLPAFEAAVGRAHVGAVMCAYNRVNDDWACENRHLLTDILKGDWDSPGFVMSDWQAYGNTTALELRNGLDLEMPTAQTYNQTLVSAALASGAVTQQMIDDHVRRLLRTLFAFGFFDRPPYVNDDKQIDQAGHAAAAQRIEQAGITLLQDRAHILPLDTRRLSSIALIGPQANRFENGNGTEDVTPFRYTTPLQAISARAGSHVKVSYDDGSDPARAASVAKAARVAIVFASDSEGEYMDKACASVDCTNMGKTGKQDALIATVAAANPNTIAVLETGDPVLTPWRNSVRGLVEAWYPGEEAGRALAAALFGDADPGGRLPATFPASASQYPTAGNPLEYPGGTDVFYSEGLDVGYRWYDANNVTPAFPFGFGLSYTTFRFRQLGLTADRRARDGLRVRFDVVNTGARRGIAVPELYVADPAASGEPPHQLKGFAKTTLAPHQHSRVTLRLDFRSFAHWDTATGGWKADPGCYGILIGSSSRNMPLRGVVALGGASCPAATGVPVVTLPA